MFPPETILHPTDFSDNSELAFRLACTLARNYHARLILLHVLPPPMVIYAGEPVPVETWPSMDGVKESLEKLKKRAGSLPVETEVREGEPVDGILNVAECTHSDLIVMGTHGRRALARMLLGSVAENVVRKAPCPVLTARPEADTTIVAERETKVEAGVPMAAHAK